MPYQNPYLYNKPQPLNWGSAGGQLNQFNNTLEQPQTGSVNWGGVAQAGIAGAGMLANTIGMATQSSGVDQNAPNLQRSATGEPVYNLGDFYNQASSVKPQGATAGETLGMAAQGAAAGSVFGVPGAIIGGITGLASGLIGGGVRKGKQRRERDRAKSAASAAQQNFNEASQAFDEQQTTQSDYLRKLDTSGRMYGLYKSPHS